MSGVTHYRSIGICLLLGVVALFLLPADVSAAGLIRAPNNLGLVGYWSFEDGAGTKATDFSGAGITGTLTNTESSDWVSGQTGKAVSLDGSDEFINLGSSSSLNPTSAMTLSAWVKFNAFSGANTENWIFGRDESGNRSYAFGAKNTGKLWLQINGTDKIMDTGSSMTTGSWNHIVVTGDSSSIWSAYLNGVLQATSTWTAPNATSINTNLGRRGFTNFEGYSNVVIDEARIYNRALSAADVLYLYNYTGLARFNSSRNSSLTNGLISLHSFDGADLTSTTSTDRSGQGNNGTLTGASGAQNKPQGIVGRVGQALNFDGTDDYVTTGDVGAIDTATTLSGCAWVKHDSISGDDIIMAKHNGNDGFVFFRDDAGASRNDTYQILIKDSDDTGTASIEGAANASTANAWTYVCFTFQANVASGLRLYINGAEDANSPVSTSGITAINAGTSVLAFGADSDGTTSPFHGVIDDVRLYNRVLSATEVSQLYNLNAKVNRSMAGPAGTASLALWHTFDGSKLTSTTSTDSLSAANNGTVFGATAAITHVQTFQATPAQNAGTSDPQISFSTPPTAGNLVVVTAGTYASGGNCTVNVTDNRGNTYNQSIYAESANALHDVQIHVWYAENVATGNPFTVTFDENGCESAIALSEYSGVATASSHTASTTATGNSTTASTGAINPADSGSLYIGVMAHNGSTRTLSESWTLRAEQEAGSTGAVMGFQELISSGSQTGTWTIGTGAVQWVGGVATFKPASNGGVAPAPTLGKIGQALSFDGTDDYVRVGTGPNQTGVMTAAAWIKPSSGAQGLIVGNASTGCPSNVNYGFEFGRATNKLTATWGGSVVATSTTALTTGVWNHVAMVRTGSSGSWTTTFYVNGVADGTISSISTNPSGGSYNTLIGSYNASCLNFTGAIDDVRVYSKALTQPEILQLYRQGR